MTWVNTVWFVHLKDEVCDGIVQKIANIEKN